MDFNGKVILITGASSGIGAATAEYFAQYGAKLALVGRNETNLQEVIQKCKKTNSSIQQPLAIVADVTKDAERIITKTIEHFDKLDVLINNAGVLIGSAGLIETVTLEQYDQLMNTNVRSVFHLTMLACPHLIRTKGNIINVSSVAGLRALPNALVYCMSKSAIDQLTRSVSLELAAKGVRCNAINPGVIVTEVHKRGGMSDEIYDKYLEHSKTTHAMGRVGNVSEVTGVIGFLASDTASFITGVCLPIDGGKVNLCPR